MKKTKQAKFIKITPAAYAHLKKAKQANRDFTFKSNITMIDLASAAILQLEIPGQEKEMNNYCFDCQLVPICSKRLDPEFESAMCNFKRGEK